MLNLIDCYWKDNAARSYAHFQHPYGEVLGKVTRNEDYTFSFSVPRLHYVSGEFYTMGDAQKACVTFLGNTVDLWQDPVELEPKGRAS